MAICSFLRIAMSQCALIPLAVMKSIYTDAAGSGEVAQLRLVASGSALLRSATTQTLILCFRSASGSSNRAEI
jgi:hypothetical protein